MARNVVAYLKSPRGEGKRMVTITGGWHVKYGFGLPKKVIRRMPMPYAILLTEEISTPEQKEGRLMNVDLPDVPLLPADFQWCVPFESIDGKRVRMGIGMEEREGRLLVASVAKGSPAEKSGMVQGDELVAFDGKPVRESLDVYYLVGEKRDGDTARVTVRREESVPTATADTCHRRVLISECMAGKVSLKVQALSRDIPRSQPSIHGRIPCRSSSGWRRTRSRSC